MLQKFKLQNKQNVSVFIILLRTLGTGWIVHQRNQQGGNCIFLKGGERAHEIETRKKTTIRVGWFEQEIIWNYALNMDLFVAHEGNFLGFRIPVGSLFAARFCTFDAFDLHLIYVACQASSMDLEICWFYWVEPILACNWVLEIRRFEDIWYDWPVWVYSYTRIGWNRTNTKHPNTSKHRQSHVRMCQR